MTLLTDIGLTVFFYLATFGALLILEIFIRSSDMTIRQRTNGLKFWAAYIFFDALVGLALFYTLSYWRPEPIVSFVSTWGSPVIAAIVSVFAADFVFYWFHRTQHRFFWRWHSVHHSIENLSAINSYHHWSEPLIRLVLIAIPLSFLDIRASPQAALLVLFFNMQPYYIHSATRLHFGPLSRLLIDNRFHRLHHSTNRQHHGANFGAITPLWDVLFGTAIWPKCGEWPVVGLVDQPEPTTFRDWSAAPFRHVK